MPVGYQSSLTVQGLNEDLGRIATMMRDAHAAAAEFFNTIGPLNVAGLEQVGFGATPNVINPDGATDAETFFSQSNYLQTMAKLFYGQAAQPEGFNFDAATAPARGGR